MTSSMDPSQATLNTYWATNMTQVSTDNLGQAIQTPQGYQRQSELRDASEQRGNLQVAAERARGQVASQTQQLEYLARRIEEVSAEDATLQTRLELLQAERAESAAVLAAGSWE